MRVSAHFLVRRDGELLQFVPVHAAPGTRAPRAGAARERCNDFSVGIELEGTDDGAFADAQYRRARRRWCARSRQRLPLRDLRGAQRCRAGPQDRSRRALRLGALPRGLARP